YKSGYETSKNELVLRAIGGAKELIKAWKVAQNLLEYQSAIATETKKMVQIAKAINPNCEVLTTRKSVPLTKKLSIKSILAGGAYPHRLGVSETILIFLEHMNIYGGVEKILHEFSEIKSRAVEKKVAIELKSSEYAIKFAEKGVDIIQFDKLEIDELNKITPILKEINQDIKILSAGGINLQNIEHHVKSGVDGVVLSAVYFAKPIDIKVEII
ncbi:MAG: ModD protein, partial [Campylobacterales bacterium]|nr:ModD protein [Campylobacterales bacterium]